MAGGIQQFSPEQARSVASSIKNKGSNLESLLNQLEKEIDGVSSWWKGESSNTFIDEFKTLKKNSLMKLVECVGKISEQVTQIANIKEQSEQDLANQLRGK
ncbi:WXG100 family type VII secretion target [Paenibacillus vini]|uniref:WXG100 family type VII secretion target n=1 Tax=Paenibacillus vini TaxID=1476024 RepID=UPI0025B6D580|nr:WXG100 family type VII secretion target [Paenibacillus vini]MDN4068708.1 WXG100 family type VII secretion target [Paenibacillus vini]